MFKSVVLAALIASASAFAPSPRAFGARTVLSAEPEWKPADGKEWKEKDFEGQLKKLEKDAEERLDEKIADLKRNIAATGKEA